MAWVSRLQAQSRSAQGHRHSCLLSDRRAGCASGGSHTAQISDPPRSWGLVCSARLAFPSKPTQEPQCGRRSSYEVDSRLTGSSFLSFCFSKWLSEPSRISVCSLCYAKAAGSTQFIPVFKSNLNSSLSKDKKHSSVPLVPSLTFSSFSCLFCSPFIFHLHSLSIIFFLLFVISPPLPSVTPLF